MSVRGCGTYVAGLAAVVIRSRAHAGALQHENPDQGSGKSSSTSERMCRRENFSHLLLQSLDVAACRQAFVSIVRPYLHLFTYGSPDYCGQADPEPTGDGAKQGILHGSPSCIGARLQARSCHAVSRRSLLHEASVTEGITFRCRDTNEPVTEAQGNGA